MLIGSQQRPAFTIGHSLPVQIEGHEIDIITDPHEILLFSVCIKSTIVVFKMTKQLSEENGGGPFCQRVNY